MLDGSPWIARVQRTIAFNHKRLNNVVPYQLEVWMTNPVTQAGFRAREEIVDDGNLMSEEHEAVHKVGTHKTGAASDEDAFSLGGRDELDRGKARQSGVRNGVRVWMEDGL